MKILTLAIVLLTALTLNAQRPQDVPPSVVPLGNIFLDGGTEKCSVDSAAVVIHRGYELSGTLSHQLSAPITAVTVSIRSVRDQGSPLLNYRMAGCRAGSINGRDCHPRLRAGQVFQLRFDRPLNRDQVVAFTIDLSRAETNLAWGTIELRFTPICDGPRRPRQRRDQHVGFRRDNRGGSVSTSLRGRNQCSVELRIEEDNLWVDGIRGRIDLPAGRVLQTAYLERYTNAGWSADGRSTFSRRSDGTFEVNGFGAISRRDRCRLRFTVAGVDRGGRGGAARITLAANYRGASRRRGDLQRVLEGFFPKKR